MAGRIIYLEADDEITSAAARIRASERTRIAVVLPYGSRVATSRINFRLLSRDALTHDKRMSIVSPDPATRALAASAGLSAFASVAEFESSLVGTEDEAGVADTGLGAVPPATPAALVTGAAMATPASPAVDVPPPPVAPIEPVVSDGTLGLLESAAVVSAGDTIRTPVAYPGPSVDPRSAEVAAGVGGVAVTSAASPPARRGVRTPWLVGGAILALAVLVAGVGAYLLLPSATIVVKPRPEAVGPVLVTVVADTAAAVPTTTPPVVPATLLTIPVAVDDTFAATGTRVALTKATGSVRFENLDPTSSNRIASGSLVSTAAGIRFRTNVTVTVPKAELVGLTIFPARASVKVTAVEGGPDGNVDAGAISIVPRGESSLFLKVGNPEATTGGTSEEFTRVTQADVDGALAALNLSLQETFREAMADPAITTGGETVFPETGMLGPATTTVPPESLVGQEVTTFALGLSATGTVITADTAPLTAIAEEALDAAIKPGYELIPGSVDIEVDDGIVVGRSVRFPVTATARQIAVLDPADLTSMVLGKPVDEARTILEAYGEVAITVSPDWLGSIPGFESRVHLTIDEPVQIETPAPSGTTSP